jgi:hypothetical protein
VTVWPFFVVFDMALLMPDKVLELSSHRIEGISQSHIHIRISMVLIGLAACDQLVPWHLQVNANVKVVALLVMAMKLFNGHAAAVDAWVEMPKLVDFVANPSFHGIRGIELAKNDLQGNGFGGAHGAGP